MKQWPRILKGNSAEWGCMGDYLEVGLKQTSFKQKATNTSNLNVAASAAIASTTPFETRVLARYRVALN
eukprot:3113129-Amphidinium_carterae.3